MVYPTTSFDDELNSEDSNSVGFTHIKLSCVFAHEVEFASKLQDWILNFACHYSLFFY